MTAIGDILYVRAGKISPDLDGCPVIVFRREGHYWKVRYQQPGQLTHDYWNLEEIDIPRYLEKR